MTARFAKRVLNARFRRRDDAVAEIIGTVLIFAVAITLFTTFIMWYVPATGTANEQHYDQQTQNAFFGMADTVSSGASQGQTVNIAMPLGIQGVPPFSSSRPTTVSFTRNADNFSAFMSYNITIEYTVSGVNHYYNTSANVTGRGVFRSNALTQFTTPVSYDLQDGFLIQNNGGSNRATATGSLPVSLNTTSSGGVALGAGMLDFSGPSVSASSTGSSMISLLYSSVNNTVLTNGNIASINGTVGQIRNITLNSFSYGVTGTYMQQWNNAFYQEYNTTGAKYGYTSGLHSWNFSNYAAHATISGQSLAIHTDSSISLASIDVSYHVIKVNSV